jgi:hypothetical protein
MVSAGRCACFLDCTATKTPDLCALLQSSTHSVKVRGHQHKIIQITGIGLTSRLTCFLASSRAFCMRVLSPNSSASDATKCSFVSSFCVCHMSSTAGNVAQKCRRVKKRLLFEQEAILFRMWSSSGRFCECACYFSAVKPLQVYHRWRQGKDKQTSITPKPPPLNRWPGALLT